MSCSCTFQPQIPIQCTLDLIALVRVGDLLGNKSEILKHAGCILGSIGAYIGGDSQLFSTMPVDLPCSCEEACDEVESALSAMSGTELSAINPATLALILKLLELILSKYLG